MSPSKSLFEILSIARGKRVAVIGDYMLDRHIVGSVRRISPEAPVPVVDIEEERSSLGGAGNVVANLASLGITPVAFGVCGTDSARDILCEHLEAFACDRSGLLALNGRRTTEKIRVIAHDQHVVRVDRETQDPLGEIDSGKLLEILKSQISSLDAIILQDYNKGVLTTGFIISVMELAGKNDIPVAVDPKFDNFMQYRRAHLFKPNLREAERALGMKIHDDSSLGEAIGKLKNALSPDVLMVTRGEKGMTIVFEGELTTIPTHARDVADVSGAGDTVISTYVACELGGAGVVESAKLANIAAGIVCEQVGVVPIDLARLAAAYDTTELLSGD